MKRIQYRTAVLTVILSISVLFLRVEMQLKRMTTMQRMIMQN